MWVKIISEIMPLLNLVLVTVRNKRKKKRVVVGSSNILGHLRFGLGSEPKLGPTVCKTGDLGGFWNQWYKGGPIAWPVSNGAPIGYRFKTLEKCFERTLSKWIFVDPLNTPPLGWILSQRISWLLPPNLVFGWLNFVIIKCCFDFLFECIETKQSIVVESFISFWALIVSNQILLYMLKTLGEDWSSSGP